MKSLFGHAERERKEGWGKRGMGIDREKEEKRARETATEKGGEREGDRDRTRHFKNM